MKNTEEEEFFVAYYVRLNAENELYDLDDGSIDISLEGTDDPLDAIRIRTNAIELAAEVDSILKKSGVDGLIGKYDFEKESLEKAKTYKDVYVLIYCQFMEVDFDIYSNDLSFILYGLNEEYLRYKNCKYIKSKIQSVKLHKDGKEYQIMFKDFLHIEKKLKSLGLNV